MARKSKVTTIELSTEYRHGYVDVSFARKYTRSVDDLEITEYDGHRYRLKSLDSVERIYDLVNHALASIKQIDAGRRGDLRVEVDVSGLQDTDL